MGTIFRPQYPPRGMTFKDAKAEGRLRTSAVFRLQYCINGRVVRESARTSDRAAALARLKIREGQAAAGQPVLPTMARLTFETAMADLEKHYQATGTRDLKEFAYRRKPLDVFFRGRRLAGIGPADADAYTAHRKAQGAASGTIRREFGTLTRLLRLAYKHGTLARLPILDRPPEGPAREGFFEAAQFEAVRRRLPADLRVAVTIAFTFGWRMQSEVLALDRRQLDLDAGTLRLDPGQTKNKDGRVVYLTPELRGLLADQLERVRAVERKTGRIIPYLFPYLTGPRRQGTRRRDFRKRWAAACTTAGVPGRLRHDLRRTAVRNMERAGVSRSVAMKLTGHKTEAIYRRYAIVSEADLQAASRQLSQVLTKTAADGVDVRRATS